MKEFPEESVTVFTALHYCVEKKFAWRPPFMLNSQTFTRREHQKQKNGHDVDITAAFKATPIH